MELGTEMRDRALKGVVTMYRRRRGVALNLALANRTVARSASSHLPASMNPARNPPGPRWSAARAAIGDRRDTIWGVTESSVAWIGEPSRGRPGGDRII